MNPLLGAHISELIPLTKAAVHVESFDKIVYKTNPKPFKHQAGKTDIHCTCSVQIYAIAIYLSLYTHVIY